MALWSTPDQPASLTWACRSFTIPFVLLDKVLGAIAALLNEENWELEGTMTIEDAVEYLDDMWDTMRRCNLIGQVISGVWDVLPDNTLPCDGLQYLRVDYPALYAAISPNLIVDADTFKTPLLNAGRYPKSPRGAEQPGDIGGAPTVTLNVNQIPSHTHQVNAYSPNIDVEGAGVPDPFAVGLPTFPILSGATGGGQSHDNMPPFTILQFALVAK